MEILINYYNDILSLFKNWATQSNFPIFYSVYYFYFFFFHTDSKEVKVFVEMMSIAAGESDFEVDRVACFEASCQAFSPIIFDLNEESGFCEFEEACKRTASAITADPKIIEKLVSNMATLL